ncbi:hypothetical protein [Paenibacillus agricola]|nr:hypothetical protein [Paenibacillus agricola]
MQTNEMKTLKPENVLDMAYDSDGRVIVIDNDQQSYFLLADTNLINEP